MRWMVEGISRYPRATESSCASSRIRSALANQPEAGAAAPVVLTATNERVLEVIELDVLRRFAVDVPDDLSSLS